MFATTKALSTKYDFLAEKFRIGYEFLRRDDLPALPVGKIDLGGGIIVQVQEYTSKLPEDGAFETHDKFFDIQYVVSGVEAFGVANREGLEISIPYNPERDITFYKEPAVSGSMILAAGDLIVVAPEDGHKPGLAIAGKQVPVKKLVIKIPVA